MSTNDELAVIQRTEPATSATRNCTAWLNGLLDSAAVESLAIGSPPLQNSLLEDYLQDSLRPIPFSVSMYHCSYAAAHIRIVNGTKQNETSPTVGFLVLCVQITK